MLRIIAGIVVGWIVMAGLVMAVFGIAMLVLGLERTLEPDSYWTTNTFNIIVLIGGFSASIVGGLVCGLIARNSKAAFGLAAVVLAMGIGSAVMNMNKPDPPPRTGPPTMQDIAAHGKEPNWFAISKTVLAVAGVIIGGQLVRQRTQGSSG